MAGIELLTPLRIETRFYPPDESRAEWLLRLRVYPDEFSMQRLPPPPNAAELDLLDDTLQAPFRDPPVTGDAPFLTLAGHVGPARAVWLLRNVPRIEFDGIPQADRTGLVERDENALPVTHKPAGLPPRIDVWLLPSGGDRFLAGSMTLDRDRIAADLDLSAFTDETLIRDGKMAETWWTSYARALELGLAIDIPLGPEPPEFEAIVVCGLGDQSPEQLIGAHAETGRLSVLAPGTATNTVEGQPTVEMGGDPSAWLPLLTGDPAGSAASATVIGVLSGWTTKPLPLPGGDTDPDGHGPAVVRALWPVLWGRSLRDMTGAAKHEREIAEWAFRHLRPEGPYPAIRVGEQPYGILPATTLGGWQSESEVEDKIRRWATEWRAQAAAAATTAGNVVDASTERLVELLGENTPSKKWGARPVAPLAIVNALRTAAGLDTIETTGWERASADALAKLPEPTSPVAPFGALRPLPRAPGGLEDKADVLRQLITMASGFPEKWREKLGLLGHLILESMLLLRARAGQAWEYLDLGLTVDPDQPLPLYASPNVIQNLIQKGGDGNVDDLRNSGEPGAVEVAKRFDADVKAIEELIERWEKDRERVLPALFATLDTASHRVDPWITGIADSRLRRMTDNSAPLSVGAYGWVDRPRPFTGQAGSPPPPGPTPAGLLHAPSHAQALTAALLRDRAVRYPADETWRINIDSRKTRAARRLAERVRLGVHPYEALGLEVERLVGDWNHVRLLRQAFPLRTTHQGQRCCDGARVLGAVLRAAEPLPAGLPADIAQKIEPLDHVLDTYADLLVADGVHALVSGEGETANAAMEAAAGLGAPPELRAIRTPRAAKTVRVSAWALVPPGNPGKTPAGIADPSFVALLDAELGGPADWNWTVGGEPVTLGDFGLHGSDILGLGEADLTSLFGGEAGAAVVSTGGAKKLAAAGRLAELLGGGDANPLVPDPLDGRDDEDAPDSSLRAAMLDHLTQRFQTLLDAALALRDQYDAADFSDPSTTGWILAKFRLWRLTGPDESQPMASGRASLAARLVAADSVPTTINALRLGIRALAGNSRLPVLPVVEDEAISRLAMVEPGSDGRPVTDTAWLETVAAVRPRLALLEARQLDASHSPWHAAIDTPDGSGDPWSAEGPVVVAYGPGVGDDGPVAIAALDAWVDSIPSPDHVTSAAFGFNGPKSRPPQAVLLAVPPDPGRRLSDEELADVVLETRLSARARAVRPDFSKGTRVSTPSALASAYTFLASWEAAP